MGSFTGYQGVAAPEDRFLFRIGRFRYARLRPGRLLFVSPGVCWVHIEDLPALQPGTMTNTVERPDVGFVGASTGHPRRVQTRDRLWSIDRITLSDRRLWLPERAVTAEAAQYNTKLARPVQ